MASEINKKILIVDDNEQDCMAMALALRREGYQQIKTACSEEHGIELAISFRPEIVFIDVVLIHMDGFDVCHRIKAIEDLDPKIIVVTGHLEAIYAPKARDSGADEILEKSWDYRDLHATIQRLSP